MLIAVHQLPINAVRRFVNFSVASALMLGAASCSSAPESEKAISATVTSIVDGDGLVVERDSRSDRISLLNIQVPPLQDENPDIE